MHFVKNLMNSSSRIKQKVEKSIKHLSLKLVCKGDHTDQTLEMMKRKQEIVYKAGPAPLNTAWRNRGATSTYNTTAHLPDSAISPVYDIKAIRELCLCFG